MLLHEGSVTGTTIVLSTTLYCDVFGKVINGA